MHISFLLAFYILTSFSFVQCELSGVYNTREDNNNTIHSSASTGDSQCVALMCISAITNGSIVEYVLQSTGEQTLGYMAIGFGTTMANSAMVIMWSNSDSSITLSQRAATGDVTPTVQSDPTRTATVATGLSSVSGSEPKLAFTIPVNTDTEQNIIWAFGTITPDSASADATIQQHLASGTLTLDLTQTITTNSSTSTVPATVSGSASSSFVHLTSNQKTIIAHGILTAIGFLILLPGGALFARYLRTVTRSWFNGHLFIQLLIAGPVIIAGVALGIFTVSKAGSVHLGDNHMKWGTAIFVIYFVQCVLGAGIHWFKPKNSRRRPPQNYIHAIIGILIIALGLYQVRTGFRTEWTTKTGLTTLPDVVDVVWYIWVVLLPVLYISGLALLPRQLKQERLARKPPVKHLTDMRQRPRRSQRPRRDHGQNNCDRTEANF